MRTKTAPDNKSCRRYRSQIERLATKSTSRTGASLARHVETCPQCRELLDDIANVQYLLDRAKWRSMPAGTLALCNRQAMKKLQQRVRESAKAEELAAIKPDLPRWQQATIHVTRSGIGVAAGLAVLMFNWTATGGLNLAHDQLQGLGQIHQQRHIGNWDDPDSALTST